MADANLHHRNTRVGSALAVDWLVSRASFPPFRLWNTFMKFASLYRTVAAAALLVAVVGCAETTDPVVAPATPAVEETTPATDAAVEAYPAVTETEAAPAVTE